MYLTVFTRNNQETVARCLYDAFKIVDTGEGYGSSRWYLILSDANISLSKAQYQADHLWRSGLMSATVHEDLESANRDIVQHC